MNRIILIAALLGAASACAAPAPANNANLAANANAAATRTPVAAGVTEADALAREKQIWDALKAKNYDAFAALLADDQIYVTNDGVHDREATLKGVRNFELTDYTISDSRLVNVDTDLYILVYKTSVKGTSEGKPIPPDEYAATAWANRGGKWLAVYHQDSAVKPPPAQPTPAAAAATPSASPAISPAASPVGSLAPAATAAEREQQVWDALKRGDWNAFADFLAADQIEVFHSGINNKSQSVEGVKQGDFRGVTLSEFKEVKLAPNAALLTYTVKSPTRSFHPAGERHATIWVNRGGKWLAVFHQGTDIEK